MSVALGLIFRGCGWARGLREDDTHAEAAAGRGASGGGGVVCGRDGCDDGQSEPAPVLVVGLAPIEPLEGPEDAALPRSGAQIYVGAFTSKDGWIVVPQGPGLGIDPDLT